jgi:hypothetical protein
MVRFQEGERDNFFAKFPDRLCGRPSLICGGHCSPFPTDKKARFGELTTPSSSVEVKNEYSQVSSPPPPPYISPISSQTKLGSSLVTCACKQNRCSALVLPLLHLTAHLHPTTPIYTQLNHNSELLLRRR